MDVTLCDGDGNRLDLGSAPGEDPNTNNGMNILDCPLLNAIARKNRDILSSALSSNGFTNYDYEWWHWSYGDQYWAFKQTEPNALYNSIDCENHPIWREPMLS